MTAPTNAAPAAARAFVPLALAAALCAGCRSTPTQAAGDAPDPRIEPEVATVSQGTAQHFRAVGLGEDVLWSVTDSAGHASPGGGAVSAEGVYTPGPTVGRWFFVRATSAADPSAGAVARVEVVPPGGSPRQAVEWIAVQREGWVLRHAAGGEEGADRIAGLVDRSLRELRGHFAGRDLEDAVSAVRLTVHVHPSPVAEAGVGRMTIQTAAGAADVHLLAPAAHGSAAGDGWVPGYGEVYFHKNLAHELSTVFLEELTRRKGGGWTFHQGPSWFVQGLEEYIGCAVAQDRGRLDRYLAQAERDEGRVRLEMAVRDDYADGCALVAFLHEELGRERLFDLLESPAADFWTALHAELGMDAAQLRDRWRAWLAQRGG